MRNPRNEAQKGRSTMLGVDLVPLDATGVARRAGLRVERDGYTRDLAFIAST